MRLSVLCALACCALLLLQVHARHYRCDKKHVLVYKYRSEAMSFGGNGSEQKNDEQTKGLVADVSLACTKKIKKAGKKALIFALKISNVKLLDEEPGEGTGWEQTESHKNSRKNIKLAKNLDRHFAKHTAVMITPHGEIKQLYGDKSEEVWVRHMKKGIIELFNSKMHGDIRFVEQSAMGDHSSKYSKTHDQDGNLLVQRTWNQEDFIRPKFNPNHLQVRGKATVVVDHEGKILLSTMQNDASLEPQREQHDVFKRMKKKLGYEEGMHPDNIHKQSGDSGLFTNSKSKSVLTYKRSVEYDPEAHGHHDDFFDPNDVDEGDATVLGVNDQDTDETSWLRPHAHILPHRLDMEDEMEDHMRRVKARELRRTTDFVKELRALRKYPDNAKLHAELATFVTMSPKFSLRLLKESFEYVATETDDLDEGTREYDRNIDYLKQLQSLMLATQTKAGQRAVMETLKHAQLVHSFLVHSLLIRDPSDPVVRLIRKLTKHGLPVHLKKKKNRRQRNSYTDEDQDEPDYDDEDEDVKALSYMVGADVAGRTKNTKLRDEIVMEIINRLVAEDDPDRMMQHINAMGNAREAIPIIIWRQLVGQKDMHPLVQQTAIDSMRYRTNDESEEEEITKFLHDVAGNKKIHSAVRASAIRAQGRRHHETRTGHSSTGHFVRQYHSGDEEIRSAVEEFLYNVGDKRAADVLERLWEGTGMEEFMDFDEDENVNTLGFIRSIGRAFRRLGRRIGDGFKKAGRAIVRVAKKVGTAIKKGVEAVVGIGKKIAEAFKKIKAAFSQAQFKSARRCNGDLCVYDPDMANFISNQGNLATIKNNKNFGFEKLIGAQVLHLYVGAVGFAGMRLDCGPASAFEWAIFARGAAYGQIFSNKVPLIEAAAEFTKRSGSNLRDRAFVKLWKSALFDRAVMPAGAAAAINSCGSANKELVSKSFPNLVNLSFRFMLGPFPIEITISATASFGVKAQYSVCISKLEASAGVVPYLTFGVSAQGSLSIIIAKGGIKIKASFSYQLMPTLSTKSCRLCATLGHEIKPITIAVAGVLEIGIGPIGKKFEKDIFKWSAAPIRGNLFEKCITLAKGSGGSSASDSTAAGPGGVKSLPGLGPRGALPSSGGAMSAAGPKLGGASSPAAAGPRSLPRVGRPGRF